MNVSVKSTAERAAALSPERLALLQRRLAVKQTQSAALQRITRRRDNGPAPLSFGQERMWFIDRLQPGSPAYNVPAVLPLAEPLDVALLERCLTEIVRRHDVLRTTFHMNGDDVVQKVGAAPAVTLEIVDLDTAADGTEAGLARLCYAEFRRPFDLTRGPLFRAVLIRRPASAPPPQHRLLLTLHHIVSDAWSLQILIAELHRLYTGYAAGLALPLPDLEIQYADFAEWQRAWLQGQTRDRLLSYWRQQLAGAPALLNLPTDMQRPAMSSLRGATQSTRLPAATVAKLKSIGNAQRCTLFMTMLSIFAVLLHRYTSEDDLVVGTPIANRGRSELEPLIGFFLNTLVLRIDASGDPTFTELLQRVREVTLGGFAHQDLPFEALVRELQPSRNLNVNPLFQVMFVLQSQQPGAADSAADSAADKSGPTESNSNVTFGISRFDLTLAWTETADILEGMFEYSTDLFTPATIERMARHLRLLADTLAEQPDLRLSQLPLLTAGERRALQRWNATDAQYPDQLCIHQLFERRARDAPEATALLCGEIALSYGELDRRANQLAHYLQGLGVGPESIVGLCVERSVEMIVSLLAVLKAGGAYLPLDPHYPAERLAFMLQDAAVGVVLTHGGSELQLPPGAWRCLAIDADWPQIALCGEHNPQSGVGPDNAAYVIYTSGSTGLPKGVIVPHRGAVNSAQVEVEAFAIRPEDRILQFASLNFDASMFELLMWLWGGATLCLAAADDIMPGPSLLRTIRDHAVTVLALPPSALAVVPVEPLESLRMIAVMGEACPPELVARWRTVVDRFFNAYGPTEASMWVAGIDLDGDRRTTIGRPIANNRIHILDEHMNPVPVGVTGEIYIGGVGVARGYLRRPALTAERFLPDPFATVGGGRLYRTGDLARYLPSGEIDFLGRSDHQVKVRGYRIELGEVETVLCRHPAVRQAAVLALDQGDGTKTLVGYVAVEQTRPTAAELRRFLQQILPDYALPSSFVVLDALPLTTSGKIAREALPRPEPEQAAADSGFVPAGNSVQLAMVGIWADVLRVARVGLDENFFDLGGHSLMAVQIISRVRDVFGVELSVRGMFDTPTVRLLSGDIERILESKNSAAPRRQEATSLPLPEPAAAAKPASAVAAVPPAAATSNYPLSSAQERMWFIEQMQPGNATYNIPHQLAFAEPVNVAALERALAELVRRHESLRTTFAPHEGGAVQIVRPAVPATLPVVDLRSIPAEQCSRIIAGVVASEASRPFDLTRGPLLRSLLLRSDGLQSWLLLTLHHIVTDGWSLAVMSRELITLYEAFRAGRPTPLREPALQYRDYVDWQRAHLQGAVIDRLLSYWRRQLAAVPTLQLPLDHPRPAAPTGAGAQRQFAIAADVFERLRAFNQRCGATMFVVMLAAFKVLLSRYCRQTDIVVGTAVANRNRSEYEGITGLFVNSLVLRTDLSGNLSFPSLVERVRRVTLEALDHQDLPFERIVAELTPERVLGVNPIFQVYFAHHSPEVAGSSAVAAPSKEHVPSTTKFDFGLHLMETSGETIGVVEYDVALFDAATIDRMVDDFGILLAAIAADADQPVSALPPLVSPTATVPLAQSAEPEPLPLPDAAPLPSDHAVAAPNPVEKAVAEIWAEVLGLQQISVRDDFFKLGGHSLQVIRVLSRLRDALDIDLSVAQFFSAPTVTGLAALIVRQPDAEAVSPGELIRNSDDAADAAISPANEQLGLRLDEGISP